MAAIIAIITTVVLMIGAGVVIFILYQRSLRDAKNYERGLKMIPMLIHLPPSSDDLDGGGRDKRDVVEEVISQAQVMYNIISSTATKGFKSKVYGQRHISFEIVARGGLVYYYTVVPIVLMDVVRQAVAAAYPSARLEEVEEHAIFSEVGKMSGTIGGEFTLKKEAFLPIATYEQSKRDASRAILNALSSAVKKTELVFRYYYDRPADNWTKSSIAEADKITKGKSKKSGPFSFVSGSGIMEALWKPPESSEKSDKPEDKQISSLDRAKAEAIEEKTRYPGYEVLIRVVVSSNTSARSQALLGNVISAFALYDSPSYNGFKFAISRNIEELVTAYIFRFFPQAIKSNVLNTIELATLFHLPDQASIPTSQVQRQLSKQVDGPTDRYG